MTSIFGPLTGPWNVEQAVLATLRTWLPTYLYEIERQNGLPVSTLPQPPVPESYVGGLDFLSWEEDECPTVIVHAEPVGEPERTASCGYSQTYEVQVAAIVITEAEDDSRQLASFYGTAISGALVQNGALGGFADETVMTGAPKTEFQDPDVRITMQSVTTFDVSVTPIVTAEAGPDAPSPADSSQYGGSPSAPYTNWPAVSSVDIDVDGEPLT